MYDYTANPEIDAANYYDALDAEGERADAKARDIRQAHEATFYRTLEEGGDFPDTNTMFDIVCQNLESTRELMGWAARHRSEHPELRGMLNDLCDSYVKWVSA